MTRSSGAIGGLSSIALARHGLASASPVGAVIGDSIATADYNGADRVTPSPAPANVLKGANGFISWALALSGQRIVVPTDTHVWGFPGQETGTILSQLPVFLAQMPRKPGVLVVECGTNNIFHNDGITSTFAAITADWQAIALYLARQNIRAIFVPILPRTSGFSALFSAAQFQVMDRCNRWLSALASRSEGRIAVASACLPDVTDPASIGAQPKAGYFHDGTHPGIAGGYYVGKAIAAILRNWYAPIDLLPANNLTWASGLPSTNFLSNAMMQGAGGAIAAPSAGTISGTAPTGWTAGMSNSAGLTVTNSQVTSVSTGQRMHQMTFGGSYTVTGAATASWAHFGRLYQTVANGALADIQPGDALEALIEFEVDAGINGFAFPRLEFRWNGASGYNADMQLAEGELPPEAISGVLRTAPHIFGAQPAPGQVALMAYGNLKSVNGTYTPSGSVRFGRAVIQKVE